MAEWLGLAHRTLLYQSSVGINIDYLSWQPGFLSNKLQKKNNKGASEVHGSFQNPAYPLMCII